MLPVIGPTSCASEGTLHRCTLAVLCPCDALLAAVAGREERDTSAALRGVASGDLPI
jgi:hypothetical protein